MTLLGLVARIGFTGGTFKYPFGSRMSVCIGVATLFSTGVEFTAGVGSCCFYASGIGVRCALFLLQWRWVFQLHMTEVLLLLSPVFLSA